ncbi:hypothetical protein [Moumouvirus maliensis]|nr:hypothetical protein [Moumouvirus maliensis]
MNSVDNIIIFDDFTFGFEGNIIVVFNNGIKIGSVFQDTHSLLWSCEYYASKDCFTKIKKWIRYCKDWCDYDYSDEFTHCGHCLFPKEVAEIISHNPTLNKDQSTIYWTCYSESGLSSALNQLKKCWSLLKDIN